MPETEKPDQQVETASTTTATNGRTAEASIEDVSVILPPGLSEVVLTPEAAEAIRAILDDPKHPTHDGREMPTADASVLLK